MLKLADAIKDKGHTVMSLFENETLLKILEDKKGKEQEYVYITYKELQEKLQSLQVKLTHHENEALFESLSNSIMQGSILIDDLASKLAKYGVEKGVEPPEADYNESSVDDIRPQHHKDIHQHHNKSVHEDNVIKQDSSVQEEQQEVTEVPKVETDQKEVEHESEDDHEQSKQRKESDEIRDVDKAESSQELSQKHSEVSVRKHHENELPEEAEEEEQKDDNQNYEEVEGEKSNIEHSEVKTEEEAPKEATPLPVAKKATGISSDASPATKKDKRQLNFSNLHPMGIKILVDLTKYITENPGGNIFEEYVFMQMIQTKLKQNSVYLINAKDFFETLEIYGIISMPFKKAHKDEMQKAKDSVQELLCLDLKYKDLLMLKKINKAVNQINADEDLKAQANKIVFDDGDIPDSPHAQKHYQSESDVDDQGEGEGDGYDDEFIEDEVDEEPHSHHNKHMDNSDMSHNEQSDVDRDYDESFEQGK